MSTPVPSAEPFVGIAQALALPQTTVDRVRSMVAHRSGELIYMRRWLHARPEISRAERHTTASLHERLRVEGLNPQVLSVGTGLVCDIGDAGPIVALRADIDALAMQDVKDVPYRSTHDNACHACGHDVHMTVVLGAGLVLRELLAEGTVHGRVRLIFEPAEESMPGGALDVIHDGWLDDVGAIFGVHCDPKAASGTLGCLIGPITSASDHLAITMTGPGGHTARPGLTVNLADEAARVVRDLPVEVQRAVSGARLFRPGADEESPHEIRLVFGTIHTGSASNVIPSRAELTGSLRTPDPEVAEILASVVPRAIATVLGTDHRPEGGDAHEGSRADGLHWHLTHRQAVVPTVNDPVATAMMAGAARAIGGPGAAVDTPHSWGGDTFGWYTDRVPGCYARLGTDWPGRPQAHDLHRPTFDVDEKAIPFGASVLALTALGWLAESH